MLSPITRGEPATPGIAISKTEVAYRVSIIFFVRQVASENGKVPIIDGISNIGIDQGVGSDVIVRVCAGVIPIVGLSNRTRTHLIRKSVVELMRQKKERSETEQRSVASVQGRKGGNLFEFALHQPVTCAECPASFEQPSRVDLNAVNGSLVRIFQVVIHSSSV